MDISNGIVLILDVYSDSIAINYATEIIALYHHVDNSPKFVTILKNIFVYRLPKIIINTKLDFVSNMTRFQLTIV